MKTLDLETLKRAVAGGTAAIRSITRLVPAGGPGDKVFPPSYMKEGQAKTKYAFETRRIGGREVKTVLLDSVASQANRMEEALLEGLRSEELRFPTLEVDFTTDPDLRDLDKLSVLQAPHRIADALLRDSTLDGQPFRRSEPGKAFTDARLNNATAVFRLCPTALIFGVWDSTGPKGGQGAKFQRALVSEIVGVDVVEGVKVRSRLDPAGIQRMPVFQHKSDPTDWTSFEAEAKTAGDDKKKAKPKKGKEEASEAETTESFVPFSRKGEGKDKGTPAAINHGNVPPAIDTEAGGVTLDHAVQTIVLSMAALRRLRFVTDIKGKPLDAKTRAAAEVAARTSLAALALAAVVFQREQGFDLRSRSILVPEGPLTLELLSADGGAPVQTKLDRKDAARLLADAGAEAAKVGFGWDATPIALKPMPKLVHLIKKSRDVAARGETEGDE